MFELSKQQEMKEMLGRYADGQVEMLQRAMDEWDRVSGRAGGRARAVGLLGLQLDWSKQLRQKLDYAGQD